MHLTTSRGDSKVVRAKVRGLVTCPRLVVGDVVLSFQPSVREPGVYTCRLVLDQPPGSTLPFMVQAGAEGAAVVLASGTLIIEEDQP